MDQADKQSPPENTGPLAGLRVIDAATVIAGPTIGMLMADFGADVIKVEHPRGDVLRTTGFLKDGVGLWYKMANRNKRGVTLNLSTDEGQALFKRLAATADVVIENFRTGTMEKWGLGWEDLKAINPRLVMVRVTGFGQTGPLRDKPSFDIVTQAMSGALSINGEKGRPPVKLGLPIGDMVGGVYGPIAILAALHERSLTGRGRLIDISLHDGLIGMLGYLAQLSFVTREDPRPVGSMHPTIVPYGSFAAADGYIIIAVLSETFWPKLCQALERPELAEDKRFSTLPDRRENREILEETISEVIRSKTVVEWERRREDFDVPYAPILSISEALSHPHARARDMVVTAEHRDIGEISMTGRPVKYPGARQAALTAPPALGEHTRQVLRDLLGLGEDELRALSDGGIIVDG